MALGRESRFTESHAGDRRAPWPCAPCGEPGWRSPLGCSMDRCGADLIHLPGSAASSRWLRTGVVGGAPGLELDAPLPPLHVGAFGQFRAQWSPAPQRKHALLSRSLDAVLVAVVAASPLGVPNAAGPPEGAAAAPALSHFLKGVVSAPGGTNHFLLRASHLAPSAFASSFSAKGQVRYTVFCGSQRENGAVSTPSGTYHCWR